MRGVNDSAGGVDLRGTPFVHHTHGLGLIQPLERKPQTIDFMRLDSDIENWGPVVLLSVCGLHGYQGPSLVPAFSAVVPSYGFMVQDVTEVLVLTCHPRCPSNSATQSSKGRPQHSILENTNRQERHL